VGVGGGRDCGETELTATLRSVSERFDETHGFFWDLCAAPPVLADDTALGALMWNVTQECTSGLP
jgi:hypothetical protein